MSTKKLSLSEPKGALQPTVEGRGERPRSYSYYNVAARGYIDIAMTTASVQYWRALTRYDTLRRVPLGGFRSGGST